MVSHVARAARLRGAVFGNRARDLRARRFLSTSALKIGDGAERAAAQIFHGQALNRQRDELPGVLGDARSLGR